nr:MAG TPA: hypothetical protein [Caudoviricetes sp.]
MAYVFLNPFKRPPTPPSATIPASTTMQGFSYVYHHYRRTQ